VSATRTALVLLLEPVFAAVLGFAAGERLGALGALGAGVIVVAILVSEVGGPWRHRRPAGDAGAAVTGTSSGT
jgi:drug/metabolite transporter (DMT)-like permease